MSTAPAPELDTLTLDEILLDLAVLIELSPHDREIAENRYRRLKEHVERPTSPLRPYLVDGESLIYAQGSVAISTTILSGDNDDRFDVDAIVEIAAALARERTARPPLRDAEELPWRHRGGSLYPLRSDALRLHAHGRDRHGSPAAAPW
jgi:hypothetical protein